jgi:methyltransferase (TIGR00027 family)
VPDRPASNTAVGVATLRAAHQILDGPPRILDDTVVVRLLGPDTTARVHEHADRFAERRAIGLRVHVLLRSRYAEERLHVAVGRGVQQFLVLGAGLDTFAYRQPEWAHGLRIYEVDHPASQDAKRERLAAASVAVPDNLTFVSVDFEHETLRERLTANGFDFTVPTFVSCLGVLVYLTMDAVADLFRFIASLAPSSEFVFTFGGHPRPLPPGTPSLAEIVAAAGEPFRSALDIDEVERLCAEVGLLAPMVPTASEIARYMGDRRDRLQPPTHNSIASAMVARRP